MDKNSLKEYLSSKYQGPESFLKEIIFPIFRNNDFEDGYETEVLDMQPERRTLAEATGIRSVKQLGCIYIGVDPLYIFDITVADRVLMQRNRVGIQRLVRMVMDNFSCAFMVFHYDDAERWDWRFTFCQKKGSNSDATDSKRYTFLLGPGQSCRTARDNFWELHEHRDHLTVQSIEHAFSVEVLSNEFFDKYKQHYEDIILYVTGKRMIKSGSKWVEKTVGEPCEEIMQQFARFENPEKAVRDYVKKLMGRLVFLQFLQKKGWLGVPVDKEWGEGEPDFSQKLFERCTDKYHFIDEVLEPLFNDLNTEREGDISKLSALNSQPVKVPYLNGGLFERDTADEAVFPLPSRYMQDLLDFFAQYNFTIDENDPNDAEVGVDPEMLGRIFENLLEDNKDKGVYYTPKEIVQYMCRESLTAYLQNDIVVPSLREAIRQFVATKDVELLGSYKDEIDQRLRDVKICDPAIGSGAFPMGLLREIYFCRAAIEGFDQQLAAEIKKHIIQQNIYGVDLERGAVDIARLRFWLSLVVDEATPHALPNLDFKIMQGNSLLEQYEGIDLSLMSDSGWLVSAPKPDMDLFGNISATQLEMTFSSMRHVSDLQSKIQQYFSIGDYRTKVALFKGIEEDVRQHILYNVDVRLGQAQRIVEELEQLSNLKPIQQKELARMKEAVARYHAIYNDVETMSFPNNRFFLWHTYFKDVFDRGGFDIVIGNPPYVSAPTQLSNSELAEQRMAIIQSQKYSTLFQKWDLYIPFIELGCMINKRNGITSMIVPFPVTNQVYARELRRYLIHNYELLEIVDTSNIKLFENASVSNCILFVRKNKGNGKTWISKIDNGIISRAFVQPHTILIQDESSYIWNVTEQNRNNKRFEKFYKLGDFCYISVGMVLNAHEKLAKGLFTKDDLISLTKDDIHTMEYIEGKDISRYAINRVRYLEFGSERCPKLIRRPTFPELYDRPKLLTNKIGSMMAVLDFNHILCDQTNRICIRWTDLKGVDNQSINGSIKRYSFMTRFEMEQLSEKIDLFYLLGLINSKQANWFLDNIRGVGNIDVNPDYIRNIPIPLASKEKQIQIKELAKEILADKRTAPAADTSQLEQQIDFLVYHLYGLTYDEVLIVDPETPITREEYENETRNDEK